MLSGGAFTKTCSISYATLYDQTGFAAENVPKRRLDAASVKDLLSSWNSSSRYQIHTILIVRTGLIEYGVLSPLTAHVHAFPFFQGWHKTGTLKTRRL